MVIGRLAPSPTGAQHVGNARTFLAAWLSVRARGGRLILRLEDIDSPRIKREADRQVLDDLRWLGLDWDEGPDVGGSHGPYRQTQRMGDYHEALKRLRAAQRVYPCTCSRSDVLEAASAPHWEQEGPRYPGTCAGRRSDDACAWTDRKYSWRFRVSSNTLTVHDRLAGTVSCRPAEALGDFVVARADGEPAYQLAVVIDDHAMGVTEVVRGDDLLPSTFRQRELYDFFGWEPPEYAHVPLVVGPDGRRLAKRHGDTRLASLRESGVAPERLVGLLAWSCGWLPAPTPVTPHDLLPHFRWDSIPRQPWIFTAELHDWLTRRVSTL